MIENRDKKHNKRALASPAPLPLPVRVLNMVGRVALVCVLGWALLFLLQTTQELRRPPEDPSATETPNIPLFSITEILNGHWHFAGMPWRVATREVPENQLAELLNADVGPIAAGKDSDEFAFSLLELLGAVARDEENERVYRLEDAELRIVAFAAAQTPKSVQTIRVAQRKASNTWTYLEAVGTPEDATQPTQTPGLLPSTANNQRLAARTDGNGELQAELVALRDDFTVLQQVWVNQGWQITPLQPASPQTHTQEPGALFLCQKGSASVTACIVGQTAQDPGMLLAVRSP